jgi:hypothetical protein
MAATTLCPRLLLAAHSQSPLADFLTCLSSLVEVLAVDGQVELLLDVTMVVAVRVEFFNTHPCISLLELML